MDPSTESSRRKLLVVGDAVAPTGFSRVVQSILEPIASRFEIHQLAINYNGDPHQLPWKLYPAANAGNSLGFNRLAWLFDQVEPDLIFMVSNLPRIQAYLANLGERAPKVPIVAYSAVEAEPVLTGQATGMLEVNCLVFYTQFSKRAFEKAIAQSDDESERTARRDLRVVPHGLDKTVFFPLEPEEPDRAAVKHRARDTLFRGDQEHRDSFVVLNANRNEPRKRIDTTIRGFAEFARDKDPFVKLYLHMGTNDVGWNVIELCRSHGIYDRLIMTNHAAQFPGVPTDELNLVFNAADVGINTASSEGWGLVSFEHAATRTAQVVPRHASCAELWSGTAEMMEPTLTLTDPGTMTDQHLVSPAEVAAALERLYRDPAHRHEVAERCYEYVTRPEFDWRTISSQWEALFYEFL